MKTRARRKSENSNDFGKLEFDELKRYDTYMILAKQLFL